MAASLLNITFNINLSFPLIPVPPRHWRLLTLVMSTSQSWGPVYETSQCMHAILARRAFRIYVINLNFKVTLHITGTLVPSTSHLCTFD